jgi:phenylacetate-CoA ligase
VEGDIVVTSLFNRAMPFIRYRIGDRGAWRQGACACGRGLPLLKELSGRRMDSFRTRDGKVVPGTYFVHLLGVHLRGTPIQKCQFVQESYQDLRFRFVLRPGHHLDAETRQEIEEKTRLVMGADCCITFEAVEDITPAPSGKFSYTISRVPHRRGQVE